MDDYKDLLKLEADRLEDHYEKVDWKDPKKVEEERALAKMMYLAFGGAGNGSMTYQSKDKPLVAKVVNTLLKQEDKTVVKWAKKMIEADDISPLDVIKAKNKKAK